MFNHAFAMDPSHGVLTPEVDVSPGCRRFSPGFSRSLNSKHQFSEELSIQSRLDGFEQCIVVERLAQEIHRTGCEDLQPLLLGDPG